jgi:hypothetical protein
MTKESEFSSSRQPPVDMFPVELSFTLDKAVIGGGEGEIDHFPPSVPHVTNEWSCTSTLPYALMACCLIKHRDASLSGYSDIVTLFGYEKYCTV